MRRWPWQMEQQVTCEFLVCVGSGTLDVGEGPERLSIVQTECTCSLPRYMSQSIAAWKEKRQFWLEILIRCPRRTGFLYLCPASDVLVGNHGFGGGGRLCKFILATPN